MRGKVLIAGALNVACAPAATSIDGNSEVWVFHLWGQSNMLGPFSGAVPAGIPLSACRMWNHSPTKVAAGEENWAQFRDTNIRTTDSGHGLELQFAKRMVASLGRCAISKISQGSTSMDDWRSVDPEHADLYDKWAASTTAALADLPNQFPGASRFRHAFVGSQSEQDCGSVPGATNWINHWHTVRGEFEAVIGTPFEYVIWARLNDFGIGDPAATTILRNYQMSSEFDGWWDQDDLPQQSGFHYQIAAYNTMGDRAADVMLPLILP